MPNRPIDLLPNQDIDLLKRKIDELNKKISELQSQNSSLSDKNNLHQSLLDRLKSEKDSLLSEKQSLEAKLKEKPSVIERVVEREHALDEITGGHGEKVENTSFALGGGLLGLLLYRIILPIFLKRAKRVPLHIYNSIKDKIFGNDDEKVERPKGNDDYNSGGGGFQLPPGAPGGGGNIVQHKHSGKIDLELPKAINANELNQNWLPPNMRNKAESGLTGQEVLKVIDDISNEYQHDGTFTPFELQELVKDRLHLPR